MSSYFNNRSAGVQKPPPVCISKSKEKQKATPPPGGAMVLQIDLEASSSFGPVSIHTSKELVFPPGTTFWNGEWNLSTTWRLSATVQTPTDGTPVLVATSVFHLSGGSPTLAISSFAHLPPYTPGIKYDQATSDFTFILGSGSETVRIWL